LAVVLRQKIGLQNTHYVHGLRGIASQHDGAGWSDEVSDGLGLDTVGTERFGLPFYTFSDSQIEKIYSDYIKQNYSVPSSCSLYIPIDKAMGFTALFGKTPVDSNIAGKLFKSADTQITPNTTVFEALSEREKDILKLIAVGMSNVEIAERLYLSEGTIRNHITAIFSKLAVSDRTQATLLAVRHQLV